MQKKMRRTETDEARNDRSCFPCRMPLNVEDGGGHESPEKKMFDLQVKPVGDVELTQSHEVGGHI